MQQLQEFKLLQHALILLGCIAFALFMLIDKGLLQLALLSDSSRLSGVIIIIYGAATLHWLWLCYQLSLEQQYINRWLNKAETQGNNQTSIHRLRESMSSSTSTDWDSDINLLADELTNRHALGHFAADTLIKLVGVDVVTFIREGVTATAKSVQIQQQEKLRRENEQKMNKLLTPPPKTGVTCRTQYFGNSSRTVCD